ncbi:hypothetical protein [Gulosibacter faecalis]|uniref:DUF2993 domain-containing protein n=1 Tax=Gulosibacter faecalis TaxID=272240 RepID=A0ABW5V0H1_9MICO|nr:hypothetical protein [Gulosibacter faecalis]
MREYLLDAARPTTSATLESLLRDLVVADGTLTTRQAADMRITSDVVDEGTRIRDVRLDVTGLRLDLAQLEASATTHEESTPEVPKEPVTSTPVTVDRGSFAGEPIFIGPLELRATGEAENVRFAWLEDANGGLWVKHLRAAEGKPARASAEFELDTRDLEPLVKKVLERAEDKAKLLEFTPEVSTPNDREAQLRLDLRVGYGIIRASIIVQAHASLDDDMVLHVHRVKFSSKNPVLAVVYKGIERILLRGGRIPERIAINEQLPAGIMLTDARVRAVGTRLTVTGEVLAEGDADE